MVKDWLEWVLFGFCILLGVFIGSVAMDKLKSLDSNNEKEINKIRVKIDSLYKERERVHVHIYTQDSITAENRENLAESRKLTDRIISQILNGKENEADNYIIVHRDSLCNECARAASR